MIMVADNYSRLNAEVVVQLSYLSNFWRSLDLPLINCEIKLNLSGSKKCITSEILNFIVVPVNPASNPPIEHIIERFTTGPTFQINNATLYVPIITLSINDNVKFLENLKQGFKRTISRNKYRSEITTLPEKYNLDYVVDTTFRNINQRLILIKIKDFNAFIENKPFFGLTCKN